MIVTDIAMPRGDILRIPSGWTRWRFDVWEFKRDSHGHIWRRIVGRGEWQRLPTEDVTLWRDSA